VGRRSGVSRAHSLRTISASAIPQVLSVPRELPTGFQLAAARVHVGLPKQFDIPCFRLPLEPRASIFTGVALDLSECLAYILY